MSVHVVVVRLVVVQTSSLTECTFESWCGDTLLIRQRVPYTVYVTVCDLPGFTEQHTTGGDENMKEDRGGHGWDEAQGIQWGGERERERERQADSTARWFDGAVNWWSAWSSLLRAEASRAASSQCVCNLPAPCFRKLSPWLIRIFYAFLPPGEHRALNGHANEATFFLLCIMVFTRNCGRRKTKMKLITSALSLPLLLIPPLLFKFRAPADFLTSFI